MSKCVNEHCDKDPLKSPRRVLWGCDGDYACSPECYQQAKEQMNHLFGVILHDDRLFADWLGVDPKELK